MQNLLGLEGPLDDDAWVLLPRDATPEHVPPGDVIVPLQLWRTARDALFARAGRTGVLICSDESVEELAGQLDAVAIIALDFPLFSDGRNYSNARILRERLGYTGGIRAVGDVLRDQIFLMRRCGFDSFALRPDRSAAAAASALHDFHHVYQQATMDPGVPLLTRHD